MFFLKIKSVHIYKIGLLALILLDSFFYIQYINKPLLGWYGSREVQTAISTYWMSLDLKGMLNYETPILGVPWAIPFEFPLYQLIVAIIYKVSSLPLDGIGRSVSIIFFFLCLWPIYRSTKSLKLDIEFYYLSSLLLLLSPLYLYWSRAFLIESTAVLMGFLFLMSTINLYKGNNKLAGFYALIFGVCCSLIKITTFPSFVLAAGAFCIHYCITNSNNRNNLKNTIIFFGILICCYLVVRLWTQHADMLKEQNPIGVILTSKNLHIWNFGTFTQRISSNLWKATILERIVPHTMGSVYSLIILLLGLVIGNNKERVFLAILLGLFLVPILIFTNLYIVHDYYEYASGFWLIFSISFSLYLIKKKNTFIFLGLMLFISAADTLTFRNFYFPFVHNINAAQAGNDKRLEVAYLIEKTTKSDAVITVFGEEWFAEIPYYAKRKAIMFPSWITNEKAQSILKEGTQRSGIHSDVVVINDSKKGLGEEINKMMPELELFKRHEKIGVFDVFIKN